MTADVFLLQAYMDTLQTQWSWILQITKCIDVHLKENAAYFQVFMLSSNFIVVWVLIPDFLNAFFKSTKNNLQNSLQIPFPGFQFRGTRMGNLGTSRSDVSCCHLSQYRFFRLREDGP